MRSATRKFGYSNNKDFIVVIPLDNHCVVEIHYLSLSNILGAFLNVQYLILFSVISIFPSEGQPQTWYSWMCPIGMASF
jgi:hypothetical protein